MKLVLRIQWQEEVDTNTSHQGFKPLYEQCDVNLTWHHMQGLSSMSLAFRIYGTKTNVLNELLLFAGLKSHCGECLCPESECWVNPAEIPSWWYTVPHTNSLYCCLIYSKVSDPSSVISAVHRSLRKETCFDTLSCTRERSPLNVPSAVMPVVGEMHSLATFALIRVRGIWTHSYTHITSVHFFWITSWISSRPHFLYQTMPHCSYRPQSLWSKCQGEILVCT